MLNSKPNSSKTNSNLIQTKTIKALKKIAKTKLLQVETKFNTNTMANPNAYNSFIQKTRTAQDGQTNQTNQTNQTIKPTPIPTTTNDKSTSTAVKTSSPAIKENYESATNITCNANNCKLPYGTCADNKTCRCLESYANFTPSKEKQANGYCLYTRSKQLSAFLLELFLCHGIGHMASGRMTIGIIKLCLCLLPTILAILYCLNVIDKKDTSTFWGMAINGFSCLATCGVCVWQIVDLIQFGLNNYNDGNDVGLKPW